MRNDLITKDYFQKQTYSEGVKYGWGAGLHLYSLSSVQRELRKRIELAMHLGTTGYVVFGGIVEPADATEYIVFSYSSRETPQVSEIERTFNDLANRWRKATRAMSTTLHMTMDNNYLDIIGMGPVVIPFILKELSQRPDHWFVALRHLAKTDPVANEDRGNILKMTMAWLDWGRKQGIL